MQVRQLSSHEQYFLHILKSNKEIPEFLRKRTLEQKNGVLLYPDSGYGSSSNCARHYKACFIIQNTLLVDNNKLIEVSMGNLSLKETTEHAERILQALNLLKDKQLPNLEIEIPEHIKFQVLSNDINAKLREENLPRLEMARKLALTAEAEEKKRRQQAMDEAAIAAVIASDVEQFEESNVTLHMTEHKTTAPVSRVSNHDIPTNPQAEEVAPYKQTKLTRDPESLIRGFLGNDIPNMPTAPQCARLTLFGETYLNMQQTEEMTRLGKMVLSGEENDVETVLTEVKKNPALLDIVITVKDPLGTPVTGTLLQLAAMAGDVDLRDGIKKEKDRGLVERLVDAGNLSKERVAKDLACITSKEAQDANDKRVERYLTIIKKFGNSLCEGKITNDEAIVQLEKELLEERSKAVNAGFIFDPRILHDTAKWFEENINRFGGWWSPQSDVFWVNGFGKLQNLLSSRDAQVARAGIGNEVDEGEMPERSLKNPSGDSHFYNASSRLGRDFYLGYYGVCAPIPPAVRVRCLARVWKTYVEQKQQHYTACAVSKQAYAL